MQDDFSLGGGPLPFLTEAREVPRLQHLVGEQLLQLVFVSKSLQVLGVGHVHPATLRLPVIEGRLADTVSAGEVGRLRTHLVLAQTTMICSSVHRCRLICPSINRGRTLTPGGRKLSGRSLAIQVLIGHGFFVFDCPLRPPRRTVA